MAEHLTCVICSGIFNDPCTLTCGHSFCRVCLTKHTKNHPRAIISKTLPCAVCRKFTKVPNYSEPVDEWAWQIKPSLFLQGLLDSQRTHTQGSPKKDELVSYRRVDQATHRRVDQEMDICSACEGVGGTIEATFWCKMCNLLLCSRCAKMHTQAPFTENHEVLLLSEAVRKKIKNHYESTQIKEKERKGILGPKDFNQGVTDTSRGKTRDQNTAKFSKDLGHHEHNFGRNQYKAFKEPKYHGNFNTPFPTLSELRPYPVVLLPPTIVEDSHNPVQLPLMFNSDVTHYEGYHGLSPSQLNRRYVQLSDEEEYSGIPYEVYRGRSKRQFILTDVAYNHEMMEEPRYNEVVSLPASQKGNANTDHSSPLQTSTSSPSKNLKNTAENSSSASLDLSNEPIYSMIDNS